MRLLILTADEARQTRFVERLAAENEIAAVIVERRYSAGDRLGRLWRVSGRRPLTLLANVVRKAMLRRDEAEERRIHAKWFGSVPPSGIKDHPVVVTGDINESSIVERAKAFSPDLLVVFGTSLLRGPLICVPRLGAVNIHTGLSPYYRGGHSTFFALYNDEPQYVGVTIHYIDPGIDSGCIIRTARPAIVNEDNVYTLECKTIALGTELMASTLKGFKNGRPPGVKQWCDGKLYYSRDFTLARRLELRRRLADGLIPRYLERVSRGAVEDVKTVS